MSDCQLLLSGFADEISESKIVAEQFAVMSALGLKYLSLRFLDAGKGVKNVLQLDDREIDIVKKELDRYGLNVSSLGSPLGKVKLFEFQDGTTNQYFEFDEYLENQVETACRLANQFGTRLIRGFSFYHPRDEQPEQYVSQAADRLQAIVNICDSYGLTYGVEVEANLVGQNAGLLMQIHAAVNHDALVLIFDGANLVTQGYTTDEVVDQFCLMLPALGWIHVKDYAGQSAANKKGYVDEDALTSFVPAGAGDSGYRSVLRILADHYDEIKTRLMLRNVPGIYADLEPHLRQGGQFGGFSGADGFGIAARAFVQLCCEVDVRCDLASFEDMTR